MSVPMTALARQTYGGRALRINDPFEVADESDADDLVALRFAKRRDVTPTPEEPSAPEPGEEVTREINSATSGAQADVAEDTAEGPAASSAPGYNRRDVKPNHNHKRR